MSAGTWYHAALVFEDAGGVTTSAKVYLNGVLSVTTETASDEPFSINQLGALYTAGGFKGLIDDVRVYDRAITIHEIHALIALGA